MPHGGGPPPLRGVGPPHGEPDLYVVQVSCAPFIVMELHYFNIGLYMTIPDVPVELVNKPKKPQHQVSKQFLFI